jgi:hypothetical protein
MPYKNIPDLETHSGPRVHRDPRPTPTKEERLRRKEAQDAESAIAMAEHEEREKAKRANMERLKAERLAREGK